MIVWLASFPRSGNTFLRTLLKRCLNYDTFSIYNDADIGGDANLSELTGHRALPHAFGSPDFDLTSIRDSKDLYFLKTHEPVRDLVREGDKVLYLVRDGRGATRSLQKYLASFHEIDVTPLELSLGLEFPGRSWSEHVSGWAPKSQPDTLLLYFEQLTAEPLTTMSAVTEFLGLGMPGGDIPGFDELHKLHPKFFNQGRRSDYNEGFSDEALSLFWLRSGREMDDFGYRDQRPAIVDECSEGTLRTAQDGLQSALYYVRRRENDSAARVRSAERAAATIEADVEAARRKFELHERQFIAQQEQLRVRQEQVLKLLDQIEEMGAASDASNARIRKLQRESKEQQQSLAAIASSTSWRLTRPLRALRLFVTDNKAFWRIVRNFTARH